ncbi:MAG: hypothetical protein K2G37_03005 [Clostridia bacterium]|nr:hypothetical protein [Clostridia bacterium]MDE7328389.1 hypothetical protein [Clostridia bacterium]
MSILLDIILLTAIVFLAAYICLSFISMSLGIKLLTSGLITILFVTLIKKLFFKKNSNVISYRRFVTYLIWQGEERAKELLKETCQDGNFEDKGEYVIADSKVIFLWTKYGSISADTAVKFYRTCKKDNIDEAYILTTNSDKKMMGLIRSFGDVALTYCTFKDVYRRLRKQDKLPADVREKIPAAQLLKLIFHSAFTRKNGFRFVGISLLLLAISFFTPFRNYYIILASINLALSIGCLVAGLIRR